MAGYVKLNNMLENNICHVTCKEFGKLIYNWKTLSTNQSVPEV